MKRDRLSFWLLLLLLPSLACQAALRVISPPAKALAQGALTSLPAPTRVPAVPPTCTSEFSTILGAANKEQLPLSSFPGLDTGLTVDMPLVTYRVNGDRLSAPALAQVLPQLVTYQRDFAMQRDTWQLFTTMIPAEQRQMLAQFEVITDGPGGILSAVEQVPGDPARWILETDVADMPDRKNLAFTLLHEFGHLLTLNSTQVPPDAEVSRHPNDLSIRDKAAAACATYFPGQGCSLSSSYVNSFFQEFWNGLYGEWRLIDRMDDPDRREARLRSFYRKYNDRFVDSYAASSPVEDIAETWAFFVLSPQPTGEAVSDEKLRFFSSYPELMALRQHIRAGLCAARP